MNKKIIDALIHQEKKIVTKFYNSNFDVFFGLCRKCSIPENVINDIYHDAFMELYKKARDGKLDTIKIEVAGYLYGIGKNLIKKYYRNKKNMIALDSVNLVFKNVEEISIEDKEELTLEQKIVAKCILKLGIICQKIIRYFYSRGLDIQEIAEKIKNKNVNVVSSQKSRCLTKLKKLVEDER